MSSALYKNELPEHFYSADLQNAILEEKLAQENDPLQVESILRLGVYYLRARRSEEARQQFLMVVELEPNFYYGYWMLGQTYVLDLKFEKGIELLKKACELSNEDELVLADLGRAYSLAGKKEYASGILEKLKLRDKKEPLHPYTFTALYCALDQLDEAFLWMERTLKERDPAFFNLFSAEGLDNLRKDPRFEKMLKKYGFNKYYKTKQLTL